MSLAKWCLLNATDPPVVLFLAVYNYFHYGRFRKLYDC